MHISVVEFGVTDTVNTDRQREAMQRSGNMNKKEIAEIKKQFTQEKCAITRICGCYVDGEKNKKTHIIK